MKVDNQSHRLEVSFIGEPLGGSDLKGCCASIFTQGHPGPLPLLSDLLQLEQWPSTFLDCHGVSGKVGQFSNPCTCSCE